MTTPEAPAHQSMAESVLAELNGMTAEPEQQLAEAPANEAEANDVEIEEASEEEAPKTRSLSWDDAVKQVPPDIAKLMRELRADYTRKTQTLAEQRRDFIREREALMKGREALKGPDELPEFDPYNEESIRARIEQEVTTRLRDALEPMQREYEAMAAEEDYQKFLTAHADFKTDTDLRSEVQHLLEQNDALDLETAYWAAKGKQSKYKAQQEQKQRSASRAARKEAALRGTAPPRRAGASSKPSRSDIKSMSNADILALAQAMNRS